MVIPCFNEEKRLPTVLEDVKKYFEYIVLVDDGSSDNSLKIAKKNGIFALRHIINLGQGASINTGIAFALRYLDPVSIITFDGDGQHDARDAYNMNKFLLDNGYDLVLGSRFLGAKEDISRFRKLALKSIVSTVNFFYGLKMTDIHNGLRVFNSRVFDQFQFNQIGMAHASEVLNLLKLQKLTYSEFPNVIKYNLQSPKKHQSMLNGINILVDLLMRKK